MPQLKKTEGGFISPLVERLICKKDDEGCRKTVQGVMNAVSESTYVLAPSALAISAESVVSSSVVGGVKQFFFHNTPLATVAENGERFWCTAWRALEEVLENPGRTREVAEALLELTTSRAERVVKLEGTLLKKAGGNISKVPAGTLARVDDELAAVRAMNRGLEEALAADAGGAASQTGLMGALQGKVEPYMVLPESLEKFLGVEAAGGEKAADAALDMAEHLMNSAPW